jgi:hypothetical protein
MPIAIGGLVDVIDQEILLGLISDACDVSPEIPGRLFRQFHIVTGINRQSDVGIAVSHDGVAHAAPDGTIAPNSSEAPQTYRFGCIDTEWVIVFIVLKKCAIGDAQQMGQVNIPRIRG